MEDNNNDDNMSTEQKGGDQDVVIPESTPTVEETKEIEPPQEEQFMKSEYGTPKDVMAEEVNAVKDSEYGSENKNDDDDGDGEHTKDKIEMEIERKEEIAIEPATEPGEMAPTIIEETKGDDMEKIKEMEKTDELDEKIVPEASQPKDEEGTNGTIDSIQEGTNTDHPQTEMIEDATETAPASTVDIEETKETIEVNVSTDNEIEEKKEMEISPPEEDESNISTIDPLQEEEKEKDHLLTENIPAITPTTTNEIEVIGTSQPEDDEGAYVMIDPIQTEKNNDLPHTEIAPATMEIPTTDEVPIEDVGTIDPIPEEKKNDLLPIENVEAITPTTTDEVAVMGTSQPDDDEGTNGMIDPLQDERKNDIPNTEIDQASTEIATTSTTEDVTIDNVDTIEPTPEEKKNDLLPNENVESIPQATTDEIASLGTSQPEDDEGTNFMIEPMQEKKNDIPNTEIDQASTEIATTPTTEDVAIEHVDTIEPIPEEKEKDLLPTENVEAIPPETTDEIEVIGTSQPEEDEGTNGMIDSLDTQNVEAIPPATTTDEIATTGTSQAEVDEGTNGIVDPILAEKKNDLAQTTTEMVTPPTTDEVPIEDVGIIEPIQEEKKDLLHTENVPAITPATTDEIAETGISHPEDDEGTNGMIDPNDLPNTEIAQATMEIATTPTTDEVTIEETNDKPGLYDEEVEKTFHQGKNDSMFSPEGISKAVVVPEQDALSLTTTTLVQQATTMTLSSLPDVETVGIVKEPEKVVVALTGSSTQNDPPPTDASNDNDNNAGPSKSASTVSSNSNQHHPPDYRQLYVKVYHDVFAEDYINQMDIDKKKLIGSIDQGTSSTRFVLYSPYKARIVAMAQMEHEQLYPFVGWHEHNPIEIWNNIVSCINGLYDKIKDEYQIVLDHTNIAGLGITNQRETTIAWNRYTGEPYYNAIVWDCTRTSYIANELASSSHLQKDRFRRDTGLPLSSYFAGTKVKWLLDHVTKLADDVSQKPNQVCFGTIDSWILYHLTGGYHSDDDECCFTTDVSNASRWLFYNLHTKSWDQGIVDAICSPHTVPADIVLPKICPSSYIYGTCRIHSNNSSISSSLLSLPTSFLNIPIGAVLGDQQAALFGQAAFKPGQAKNTYGTGLFLMMNTGTEIVPSSHGLLTTVAYQIGANGPIYYALEGSVSFSGSTIQWLRDQLGIINDASESETLAGMTESNDGLYFVPAFNGLLAPFWQSDARGCIVGMTSSHHKGHICRAALEATAYQTKSVFDAIIQDCAGVFTLQKLYVDGGGTNNQLLMQFQADMIRVPVIKPKVMETTSMGAAFAAGLAIGIYKDVEDIQSLIGIDETFVPTMSESLYQKNWSGWTKAITRSFNWIVVEDSDEIAVQNTKKAPGNADENDPNVNSNFSESIDEEHDMVILKRNDMDNFDDDATVVVANLPSPDPSPTKSQTMVADAEKTKNLNEAQIMEAIERDIEISKASVSVTANVFVGDLYDLDESTLFREGVTYEALPPIETVVAKEATESNVVRTSDIVDEGKDPAQSPNHTRLDRISTVSLILTTTAAMTAGYLLGAMKKR